MMAQSFSATIGQWADSVEGAVEAIFKESAQAVVEEMDTRLVEMVYKAPPAASGYKRTGFLRASLLASTSSMPALSRTNPGGDFPFDMDQVEMTIQGAAIGSTVFAGYTAAYSGFVHSGANGQPPRPWVDMAAQMWPTLVAEKAAAVKQRFGL